MSLHRIDSRSIILVHWLTSINRSWYTASLPTAKCWISLTLYSLIPVLPFNINYFLFWPIPVAERKACTETEVGLYTYSLLTSALYTPRKITMNMRLGGPRSRSGCFGRKQNLLPLPGISPHIVQLRPGTRLPHT
jgi:hypothetical protein